MKEEWQIKPMNEISALYKIITNHSLSPIAESLTHDHAVIIVYHFNTYGNLHPMQKYRQLKGLTQQQFADDLGCCLNSVKFWETGRREPSEEWRIKLSEIGVEV